MEKIYFEVVSIKGKKTGKCLCGKRLVRQKTFEQTLNPFNKVGDRLKTRSEIYEELQKEKEDWLAIQVHHDATGYWQLTSEQRNDLAEKKPIAVKLLCGVEITGTQEELY